MIDVSTDSGGLKRVIRRVTVLASITELALTSCEHPARGLGHLVRETLHLIRTDLNVCVSTLVSSSTVAGLIPEARLGALDLLQGLRGWDAR